MQKGVSCVTVDLEKYCNMSVYFTKISFDRSENEPSKSWHASSRELHLRRRPHRRGSAQGLARFLSYYQMEHLDDLLLTHAVCMAFLGRLDWPTKKDPYTR